MRKIVQIEEARAARRRRDALDLSSGEAIKKEMAALYTVLLDEGLDPNCEDKVRALSEARKVLKDLLDSEDNKSEGTYDPAAIADKMIQALGSDD